MWAEEWKVVSQNLVKRGNGLMAREQGTSEAKKLLCSHEESLT